MSANLCVVWLWPPSLRFYCGIPWCCGVKRKSTCNCGTVGAHTPNPSVATTNAQPQHMLFTTPRDSNLPTELLETIIGHTKQNDPIAYIHICGAWASIPLYRGTSRCFWPTGIVLWKSESTIVPSSKTRSWVGGMGNRVYWLVLLPMGCGKLHQHTESI